MIILTLYLWLCHLSSLLHESLDTSVFVWLTDVFDPGTTTSVFGVGSWATDTECGARSEIQIRKSSIVDSLITPPVQLSENHKKPGGLQLGFELGFLKWHNTLCHTKRAVNGVNCGYAVEKKQCINILLLKNKPTALAVSLFVYIGGTASDVSATTVAVSVAVLAFGPRPGAANMKSPSHLPSLVMGSFPSVINSAKISS